MEFPKRQKKKTKIETEKEEKRESKYISTPIGCVTLHRAPNCNMDKETKRRQSYTVQLTCISKTKEENTFIHWRSREKNFE